MPTSCTQFPTPVTVRRGRLRPPVNFNGYRLEPDTWPWVRPGHAAPWSDLTGADVTLIISYRASWIRQSAVTSTMHGAVLRIPQGRSRGRPVWVHGKFPSAFKEGCCLVSPRR